MHPLSKLGIRIDISGVMLGMGWDGHAGKTPHHSVK